MDWRAFARKLLMADRRISETEAALLQRAVAVEGLIDREGVDFLLSLKREAVTVHPTFDDLLFRMLEGMITKDGSISDAEALWLRKIILRDNQPSPGEIEFLARLRRGAKQVGPEFERLYRDCTQLSGDLIFR